MNKYIKSPRLGDIHNGKYVEYAVFDNRICIKKPRSADVESAFIKFIQNLENLGYPYVPGTVEIIRNTKHEHYVEITEHKSVDSPEKVRLYYIRCGTLLFLSYLFSSSDLHRENIIAAADKPTIIDYETLLSGEDEWELQYPVMLSDSVWASYLLPRWIRNQNTDVDYSGLTGHVLDKDGVCSFISNPNILYLNKTPTFAWDYVEDILHGFRCAYDFFMEKSNIIEGWLDIFNACPFRVILRRTEVYTSLVQLLEGLPALKREMGAEVLLERAYKKNITSNESLKFDSILKEEVRAVLNGEVPLFIVKGNETAIRCREEIICNDYYVMSPVERAKHKLKSLSLLNREGQVNIILQLLNASKPISDGTSYSVQRNIKYSDQNKASPMKKSLPYECISILNTLEENYIEGMPDSWLYLNREQNGYARVTGVGMGEYHGVTGILCFYAALFSKTGDNAYYQKLLEHYAPIRDKLNRAHILLNAESASLNQGVGGILLALYHIGELTGISDFAIDADSLANRIIIPNVLSKGSTDVLNGYAGLAVALLKIRNENTARRLAKALLPVLMEVKPTLTGYAHGAAGYSLAIGVLVSVLEDKSCNDRLLQLLNWENSYYDRDKMNWRDLRNNNSKYIGFMNGWCSGTPGIVMARKQLYDLTDDNQVKEACINDIIRSKKWFETCTYNDHDSLCCGNAAKLMAASRLGFEVQSIYEHIIASVQKDNLNLQHLIKTCDFIPGLMQGYAGIGYALAMYGDKRSGGMLV